MGFTEVRKPGFLYILESATGSPEKRSFYEIAVGLFPVDDFVARIGPKVENVSPLGKEGSNKPRGLPAVTLPCSCASSEYDRTIPLS